MVPKAKSAEAAKDPRAPALSEKILMGGGRECSASVIGEAVQRGDRSHPCLALGVPGSWGVSSRIKCMQLLSLLPTRGRSPFSEALHPQPSSNRQGFRVEYVHQRIQKQEQTVALQLSRKLKRCMIHEYMTVQLFSVGRGTWQQVPSPPPFTPRHVGGIRAPL